MRAFLKSKLDYLYIEDFIIEYETLMKESIL